jgi:hypothetical protein
MNRFQTLLSSFNSRRYIMAALAMTVMVGVNVEGLAAGPWRSSH